MIVVIMKTGNGEWRDPFRISDMGIRSIIQKQLYNVYMPILTGKKEWCTPIWIEGIDVGVTWSVVAWLVEHGRMVWFTASS
jgi:hypothetical protein